MFCILFNFQTRSSNSKYHKNYIEFGEPYQLVLPLNLEGLIPDNDSINEKLSAFSSAKADIGNCETNVKLDAQ